MSRVALKAAAPGLWARMASRAWPVSVGILAVGVCTLRALSPPDRHVAEFDQHIQAVDVLRRQTVDLLSAQSTADLAIVFAELARLPEADHHGAQQVSAPVPVPPPRVRVTVRTLSAPESALEHIRRQWLRGDAEAAMALATRASNRHVHDRQLARALRAMARRSGLVAPVLDGALRRPVDREAASFPFAVRP